jgi:hypothetical protein
MVILIRSITVCFLPKTFNYLTFQLFWLWRCFLKVIAETRRVYWIRNLRLYLCIWPSCLSSDYKSSALSGVHVIRSLVICVMFCRSLFALLPLFFWPLCCLSSFYLRILITPLVSSNSLNLNLWICFINMHFWVTIDYIYITCK